MFFYVWEHNPTVVLGMWSEFIARQNVSGVPAPAHVISDMGLVRQAVYVQPFQQVVCLTDWAFRPQGHGPM